MRLCLWVFSRLGNQKWIPKNSKLLLNYFFFIDSWLLTLRYKFCFFQNEIKLFQYLALRDPSTAWSLQVLGKIAKGTRLWKFCFTKVLESIFDMFSNFSTTVYVSLFVLFNYWPNLFFFPYSVDLYQISQFFSTDFCWPGKILALMMMYR